MNVFDPVSGEAPIIARNDDCQTVSCANSTARWTRLYVSPDSGAAQPVDERDLTDMGSLAATEPRSLDQAHPNSSHQRSELPATATA